MTAIEAPVRERPMLFSGEMVRAILAGRKTQTRRVVTLPNELKRMGGDLSKAWPDLLWGVTPGLHVPCSLMGGEPEESVQRLRNPWNWSDHRAPILRGESEPDVMHLWVREAWQAWDRTSYEYDEWEPWTQDRRGGLSFSAFREEYGDPDAIEYRATSDSMGPWQPSIHMPRWASRLTLEITGVRVERVCDISEVDAHAEGVSGTFCASCHESGVWPDGSVCEDCTGEGCLSCYTNFRKLWDSINGARGYGWSTNPYVWAVTFRVLEP
jgi:hypothetical protein